MQEKDKSLKRMLTPRLFWDMDFEKLDIVKNKRIIVERVFSYGSVEQFRAVCETYTREEIIQEVKQIGYLDPKTFEFVVTHFSIPKTEMKCYIKKQLQQQHWS